MLIVYPMHNFFRREQRYAPFDYNWPIFIQLDPIHQRKFINWNSDSIKQRIINSCKVLFLTVFPAKCDSIIGFPWRNLYNIKIFVSMNHTIYNKMNKK